MDYESTALTAELRARKAEPPAGGASWNAEEDLMEIQIALGAEYRNKLRHIFIVVRFQFCG